MDDRPRTMSARGVVRRPLSIAHRLPRDPVIVMGMHKSGTSLLAEMLHRGGTPMFPAGLDPDYDRGIKYERPLCQELNRVILGGRPADLEPVWKRALHPLSEGELSRLATEVGDEPWGFKDPRTIWTYGEWLKHFPRGPRLYVYRGHREVVRHFCRRKPWHLLRVRRALLAWLHYNERMLENFRLDESAGRHRVLVRYETLMGDSNLVPRIEQAAGVRLCDARDPQRRRNKVEHEDNWKLRLASIGYGPRIARLHEELATCELKGATA